MLSAQKSCEASRDERWSSDGLFDKAALSAWNDVVSTRIAEMCIDSEQQHVFKARWAHFGLGPIDIHSFQTAEQTITRSQAMARRSSEEVYALSYMKRGTAVVHHAGSDVFVPEGSFVFVNHALPYSFRFPQNLVAITSHMPLSWLRRWVPQPEALLARTFDATPWGAALAAMLSAIDESGMKDATISRSSIADQLGAFLSLMVGNEPSGESLHQNRMFQRATMILRDRYDDVDLTPCTVAAELNISKRYVHKIFAGNNTTFGAELLALRLSRAADMLKDRRYDAYRMNDVAFACGFSDSSHFARRFREKFGMTPLQVRKQH